jgi:Kdo2-lipid IVA lauroyltransferase/acyltransferase
MNFSLQYLILQLIAMLPLPVLYFFSDALYYLLYYIVAYRRKVVRENLVRSFPEKGSTDILHIEKAFYRHFADLLVENIKMLRLSKEQMNLRMKLVNPELIEKYRDQGRSIVAVGGHYNNWEWTLGIVQHLKYKTIGIYKPLNNKKMDGLINKSRTKFGSEMVSLKDVVRVLIKYRHENTKTFNVFVADQSPIWREVQYWTTFMNQLSAVYLGPEKLARQFNMVVLYGKVSKRSRGMYEIEFIPIEENAPDTREHEITEKFFRLLEDQIREAPEYWLWSHRRWKLTHRRAEEEKKGIFRFSADNTRISPG